MNPQAATTIPVEIRLKRLEQKLRTMQAAVVLGAITLLAGTCSAIRIHQANASNSRVLRVRGYAKSDKPLPHTTTNPKKL